MSIKKFYNPTPVDFMNKDPKVFLGQQEANWNIVKESDAKAKAAKTLEGRYITFPQADGQAVYIITRQGERTCTAEVVTGIGDDWVSPFLGKKGSLKTDLVIKIIRSREGLEALFAKKDEALDRLSRKG